MVRNQDCPNLTAPMVAAGRKMGRGSPVRAFPSFVDYLGPI